MGLWVAQGINNSKPITCPSKFPVLVAHLGWLMYPHSSEMGSSSPSSSAFDEQVCPVATATATMSTHHVRWDFHHPQCFLALVTFFFFHLFKPLFVRMYLELCVHLQLPNRNRKNSEEACWWLVHKWPNTHAWGQRGVLLHVPWWWQQVGFRQVETKERRGVTHSVRSRRCQALTYLRESTVTIVCCMTGFSSHLEYGISTFQEQVWCGYFSFLRCRM